MPGLAEARPIRPHAPPGPLAARFRLARERSDSLRALLRQAPPAYLDVLLARYRDDLRVSAIAAARCETTRAIEGRLVRAVAWLERSWLRRERGLATPSGRGIRGNSRGIPAPRTDRGGRSTLDPSPDGEPLSP